MYRVIKYKYFLHSKTFVPTIFFSLQVELYADFEPRLLLTFLRTSQHYNLDKVNLINVYKHGLLLFCYFFLKNNID